MAGCMPGLGGGFAREARAAAPRHRGWLPSCPVGDDSDSDEEDTLPARFMFDLRGCVPPSPRPPATRAPSDGCFQEFGAMLRALEDQAAAGAPPQERMMGVCRIVLAHVATWLKPVVKAPLSALRLPGVLGLHTLRRVDLEGTAGEDGAVLLYQEQSVLRNVCFADQYLHVSQRIQASMRIHIQPRVIAQGGGMLLILMDGMPPPMADLAAERDAAAAHEEAVANAIAQGLPAPAPPKPPPPGPPMTIELGGAAFYPWPKRFHLPPGAPPGTPPLRPIRNDVDPPGAPPAFKETYRIRLPGLKLSGLERAVPTASLVRSAVIECEATGLVARIRFVPFRPMKDGRHNILIGFIGAKKSAAVSRRPSTPTPPLPRRRGGDAAPGGIVAALASLLPRRRSGVNVRRTLSGTSIDEDPEAERAAQMPAPPVLPAPPPPEPVDAPLSLYGVLDGKVFICTDPLPHPAAVAAPERGPMSVGSAASPNAVLLYDDSGGAIQSTPLSTGFSARNITPILKSPALMLQNKLWLTVIDALRTAVAQKRVGAHPVTRELLLAALQREGPQVTKAKLDMGMAGKKPWMQYAASWIVTSQPTTHLPPALDHPPPRPPQKAQGSAAESEAEASSSASEPEIVPAETSSTGTGGSWEVVSDV